MEPPVFPPGQRCVRAAPGAAAALLVPCPAGTQPFTYEWSRAGASLDERFASAEEPGGVRLTVSAARTGDSGVYTLQATNAAGRDTARVRLEVSADEAPSGDDPPTFLRRLQDLTVKVGTRTRFLVEIVSSTECKVTWYRNERRLMEAERVSLVRDGTFWCADIAAVSVDDTGRWTCTAENAGGRASCSAHLNVLVPKAYKRPEFVEELRALLTEQGTVSLECKVVGVPTPVLRWFKDSREIKAGDVFALTANAEDPTSLGTYTCEAVNCMGRAYSSSKVHVVGRGSREGSAKPIASGVTPESPPIFTKELEDKYVRISEPLTLGCHVVVPPWPRSVVWYNKEGKVEPGDRYHVVEDGVGGYMVEIPAAEWPDEGEWKCVATSSGGRVGFSSCYVSMDVPKNYRKPRFMENLQAVLTEEGLVSFECKVVGFPTPVLSWFKDGQELKPGDVYQLTGTNSLGSYCCIARNCMGQASSSAELTVEDIQNQLNEEEKLQLFSKNQAPKFVQGLKSVEAKIDEPFRFTIKVAIPPEPSVQWYRDDQPVDDSPRCHLAKEERGVFNLDIQGLEFLDQAEWKCVAVNDFGHSVTSCFLKLIIPRHYKKPRFLENLQAILSDEGAVNLECKVIGVPQPVLKWYKDGEELKPGDIHRIISGQDGTCCLGTYTCEAQNCMGIAASSASLLGFDDSMKAKANKKKAEEQALQRNVSLSTIHEERSSQMYDTPVGDITLDDKAEISFSFDGKEVSVSLYETPDLTEEDALQIMEMYADQISENVTEHNVAELPPLRFVKETSTSGNLLMEAIIIDVSPEYFASPEEDLRTEADVEDISIADENGPPQLSFDQDIGGEDYLEKTMDLLSQEKADIVPKKILRKKSDSQRSVDDYFSLSMDQTLSEDKKDDDTQILSESYASARSLGKLKSKSSKPSLEEGQDSSELTKTILVKDDVQKSAELETPVAKPKRERRSSRSSRRSSSGSEKSYGKAKEESTRPQVVTLEQLPKKPSMDDEEFRTKMTNVSTSLSKVINDVQIIERDIILKSELMSSAATASRSLEIISSLIKPLSEINSIADAARESAFESKEVSSTLFNNLSQPLRVLQQSLTIIEKCIDVESDNKTLVKKTCVAFIETCGEEVKNVMNEIVSVTEKDYLIIEQRSVAEINSLISDMNNVIRFSSDTIKTRNLLSEASEIKKGEPSVETKHLRDTQKAVFELKSPLNSLLRIVDAADEVSIEDLAKIRSSEVILNDMSASVQDLQAALEQIESLSVKESTTSLHKYNTEIIETVMESVLKLRGSFEQLSVETKNEEDKELLKQALDSIKNNLSEISSHITTIERNVGGFDILQSDNKLEMLQKMAQILITLENNLPRLENMADVKTNMDVFHKNLTRVLENVIESNEAPKYFTLMEICDAVNRLNASIKNLDTDNVLALASINNTLRIIQDTFIKNIFDTELNCSVLTNITDVLLSVQEALNHADEISLQLESEHVQDIIAPELEIGKANAIIEHIQHTIATISTVKSVEMTEELKKNIGPVLESISPVLEDLKRNIASAKPTDVRQEEHVSELSDASSVVKALATPLLELNQNLLVLNQVIVDNIESLKENNEVVSAIAEPLHELHNTLQILQQDVISQYGEDITPYDVSVNIVSAVQNLQSCIVMIQEQQGYEGVDEMSTLEDISGIKTTAETIPSDRLVLPTAEETAIDMSLEPFKEEMAPTATAHALQTLNEHITVLQTPEVVDALDTLSEVSDYSSLKSVALGLGELHAGIEEILHPFVMENSSDIPNLINTSKLAAIAEPMQELQQSLSVLDTSNIPIYEHILEIPTEKIHSVLESISGFKEYLGKCIQALFPAMETADKTIEISNKVEALRDVCENLKVIIETTKDISSGIPVKQEVIILEETVNSLLNATDVTKGIQIQQVKAITEELYEKVMTVQEDLIQYTPHTVENLVEEAKLIQAIDEIENNIAVLEQYDFVDLSRASEITSCATPTLAMEMESEPLVQMDDILQNAVNVLQDSAKESPLVDLMILEDFFKTCKSEFTIIRLIISKPMSHKKVIRLIQEFTFLQNVIKDFKTKRQQLHLSSDVESCLKIFFLEADENLKIVQDSLLKVMRSQSEILFSGPLAKLDNTQELLSDIAKAEESKEYEEFINKFMNVIEVAKPILQTAEIDMTDELTRLSGQSTAADTTPLVEKIEELMIFMEEQTLLSSINEETKEVMNKVNMCLQKHQDYKDATGTGKNLIILKCLSECADLLQAIVSEKKTAVVRKVEDHALKEVLTEMLQPLHALHSQLVNIQEQVASGVEENSVSIDITSTESIIEAVSEIHKDIVQQMELVETSINNEDISLIMEADKEIHAIQETLQSLESVPVVQELKEIAKPIEEIEKSLHNIITTEKTEVETADKLPKEKDTALQQHIDQFIEFIEVVEEISTIMQVEELQKSVNVARELRDIAAVEIKETVQSTKDDIQKNQAELALQLQNSLSNLNVQVLENIRDLQLEVNSELLERFANTTAQLQTDLSIVTTKQAAVLTAPGQTTLDVQAIETKLSSDIPLDEFSITELSKSELEARETGSAVTTVDNATSDLNTTISVHKTSVDIEDTNSKVELIKTDSISKDVVVPLTEDNLPKADEKTVLEATKEVSHKEEVVNITDVLKQSIEEFITEDLSGTINKLSAVIDIEELKQTVNIAKQLRENIAVVENVSMESETEIKTEKSRQVELVQQLQNALSTVQEQIFDNFEQLQSVLDESKLQEVADVTTHLQSNLIACVSEITPTLSETIVELTSEQIGTQKNLEFSVEDKVTSLSEINEKAEDLVVLTEKHVTVTEDTEQAEQTVSFKPEALTEVQTVPTSVEEMKLVASTEIIKSDALKQSIDGFISEEIIETIDNFSTAVNVEEIKHTVELAKELRENIAAEEKSSLLAPIDEQTNLQKEKQGQLVHDLQTALLVVQEQIFDNYQQLEMNCDPAKLKEVADITVSLQTQLAAAITSSSDVKEKSFDSDSTIVPSTTSEPVGTAEVTQIVPKEEVRTEKDVENIQEQATVSEIIAEESLETLSNDFTSDEKQIKDDAHSESTAMEPTIHDTLVDKEKGALSSEVTEITDEVKPVASKDAVKEQVLGAEITKKDSDKLKLTETVQPIDADTNKSAVETLTQNIKAYTSDDFSQTVKVISSFINLDEFNQSLEIAEKLKEVVAIVERNTVLFDDVGIQREQLEELSKQQASLAVELQHSLSILQHQLHESDVKLNLDDVKVIQEVRETITELESDLRLLTTTQPFVHQSALADGSTQLDESQSVLNTLQTTSSADSNAIPQAQVVADIEKDLQITESEILETSECFDKKQDEMTTAMQHVAEGLTLHADSIIVKDIIETQNATKQEIVQIELPVQEAVETISTVVLEHTPLGVSSEVSEIAQELKNTELPQQPAIAVTESLVPIYKTITQETADTSNSVLVEISEESPKNAEDNVELANESESSEVIKIKSQLEEPDLKKSLGAAQPVDMTETDSANLDILPAACDDNKPVSTSQELEAADTKNETQETSPESIAAKSILSDKILLDEEHNKSDIESKELEDQTFKSIASDTVGALENPCRKSQEESFVQTVREELSETKEPFEDLIDVKILKQAATETNEPISLETAQTTVHSITDAETKPLDDLKLSVQEIKKKESITVEEITVETVITDLKESVESTIADISIQEHGFSEPIISDKSKNVCEIESSEDISVEKNTFEDAKAEQVSEDKKTNQTESEEVLDTILSEKVIASETEKVTSNKETLINPDSLCEVANVLESPENSIQGTIETTQSIVLESSLDTQKEKEAFEENKVTEIIEASLEKSELNTALVAEETISIDKVIDESTSTTDQPIDSAYTIEKEDVLQEALHIEETSTEDFITPIEIDESIAICAGTVTENDNLLDKLKVKNQISVHEDIPENTSVIEEVKTEVMISTEKLLVGPDISEIDISGKPVESQITTPEEQTKELRQENLTKDKLVDPSPDIKPIMQEEIHSGDQPSTVAENIEESQLFKQLSINPQTGKILEENQPVVLEQSSPITEINPDVTDKVSFGVETIDQEVVPLTDTSNKLEKTEYAVKPENITDISEHISPQAVIDVDQPEILQKPHLIEVKSFETGVTDDFCDKETKSQESVISDSPILSDIGTTENNQTQPTESKQSIIKVPTETLSIDETTTAEGKKVDQPLTEKSEITVLDTSIEKTEGVELHPPVQLPKIIDATPQEEVNVETVITNEQLGMECVEGPVIKENTEMVQLLPDAEVITPHSETKELNNNYKSEELIGSEIILTNDQNIVQETKVESKDKEKSLKCEDVDSATPLVADSIVIQQSPIETQTKIPETLNDIAQTSLVSDDLQHHIEALISDEMVEALEELAVASDMTDLKESINVAKELLQSISVESHPVCLEETKILTVESQEQQAELKDKLSEALTVLQTKVLEVSQEMTSSMPSEKLEQITEVVTHLQEDLKTAITLEMETFVSEHITESSKEESMKQLENLLQEVSDKIDLSSSEKVPEDNEALRDSLDEVQTVIIKLKRDFDGANDTLNETLDDLECSVRSVQLQINEDSPPELLKEACATLQLLVNNMSETSETCVSETTAKDVVLKDVIDKCSNETEQTVQLLQLASNISVSKTQNKLGDIVSNLNRLSDTMKSLRSGFTGNAETLIQKGTDIIQSLDQIEEKVFSIEREIEAVENLPSDVKENMITAVHAVYGSISNMRSTISSTQKQYMFENYGQPSENLLRAIKNLSALNKTTSDDADIVKCKKLSKSLRNVLNHFEDVKFYINLDKTARLPSDAAFTKVILEDLRSNIQTMSTIDGLSIELQKKLKKSLKCVQSHLQNIEVRSTLEVKEKIPMFKIIAAHILDVTEILKSEIETKLVDTKLAESTDEINLEIEQSKLLFTQQEAVESTSMISDESALEFKIETSSLKAQEETVPEVMEKAKPTEAIYIEATPSTSKQALEEIATAQVSDINETIVKDESQSTEASQKLQKTKTLETIDLKIQEQEKDSESTQGIVKLESDKTENEGANIPKIDDSSTVLLKEDLKQEELKEKEAEERQKLETAISKAEEERLQTKKQHKLDTATESKKEKAKPEEQKDEKVKIEEEKLQPAEDARTQKEKSLEDKTEEASELAESRQQEKKNEGQILELQQKEKELLAEIARVERESLEKQSQDLLERERLEAERLENELRENERLEKEKLEKESLEKQKLERERQEKEKTEMVQQEKIEKERLEKEQLEKEKEEQKKAKREEEQLEKEKRKEEHRLENERLEKENIEKDKLEKERQEKEKLDTEQQEKERLEQERIEKEIYENKRLEKEKLEKEQLKKEQLEQEQQEKERLEKERIEKEMQEKVRRKREKQEEEQLEKEMIEREQQEKEQSEKEKIEKDKQEKEKLDKEKQERERLEKEQLEQEQQEKERQDKDKFEKEKQEEERLKQEKERLEKEKMEQEQLENERIEKEKQEKERLKKEKQEKEKMEQERQEKERIEKEKQEKERLEKDNQEKERLAKEQEQVEKEQIKKDEQEKERLKKEKQEREKLEKEKIEQELREKEALEKERVENEKLEKERLEKEKLEKERFEKEQLEKEKQEKERIEKEKMDQEQLEKEILEKERIEKEKQEKKRLKKEKQEKERLEKEKMEQEKLELERLEKEKERLEKEKIEEEQLEKEKMKQEQVEKERLEKEKERLVKEKMEQKQLEKEKMEQEQLEKEKLEKEKEEKERLKKEIQEKEKIEQQEKERLEKEKIDQQKKEQLEKKKIEQQEKERQEKQKIEQQEKERLEKEKIEQQEKERLEKEKIEQQEKERLEKEKIEQQEKERLEKEKIDQQKKEQLEKEKIEQQEKERLEKENIKQQQKERLEKEKIEQQEKERLEKGKIEQQDKERLEKEKIEQQEKERLEKGKIEQQEKERLEKEKIEQQEKERLEKEKVEQQEKERVEIENQEKERLEKEKQEKEKLELEKLEFERVEQEKMEKAKQEKKRLKKEKMEKEKQKAERIEKEKQEKERVEKENIEREQQEKERLEKERLEKERLEKERLEKEQEEKEKIKKEKELQEKEKLERERIEQENQKKERIQKVKLEKEQQEKEKLEKENIAKAKQEKVQKEKLEKEQQEKVKADKEILEKKRLEKEKIKKEEQEKQNKEKLKKEKEEKEKVERENEEKKRSEKEQAEKKKEEDEKRKLTKEKEEIESSKKDKPDKKRLKKDEKVSPEKDKVKRKSIDDKKKLKKHDVPSKERVDTDSPKMDNGDIRDIGKKRKDKAGSDEQDKKILTNKVQEDDMTYLQRDTELNDTTTHVRREDRAEISKIKLLDEKEIRSKDSFEIESRKLKSETKLGRDDFRTTDESRYIKEYQYEPSMRPKHDDREKPRFIDHNHRDYTMEFARPSAYREKTIEVDNVSFEKNTGRGHIYKANTLVMEAQLRSSAPPRSVPDSTRCSEPTERRLEVKQRSKAMSEARSIISEKRTTSRDVRRKPVFSTFLTDRTAVEGSRVKLTCSVLSSSDPKVTWYKNGVLLDNKLKYRTKLSDGLITLEVLNAVPTDSAEYSCTVENENGSVNTSANLKVYPSFEASPIPPTFTRSIRDTFHLAENELVLECRIRGQPLPTITWLKDDRPVGTNDRYQAYYLADGVCRLAINHPTPEDSGKYTCKAENSVWSDQITHVVNFTGKESRLSPNLTTIERSRFNRQALESTRRPHFGNVLTDYKVTTGGTIGLQVEIRGAPTRVEWLREGRSVIETYTNARTYVEQGLYTLALSDVTERESGLYTCRAWSSHGTVDMNAAITVVQPNELEGKPAIIAGRPEKDVLISVGEDLNISFRAQGEPKPKVIFMKGIRDITNSQRVCKMTSDDYVKFTVKRSVVSDAGTYCVLARNAYGCDRAFVTVVVRQRASSENLISDWTYPMDDSALSITERKYKSVPERIAGEPAVVDGGSNWVSLAWPKPESGDAAPVLAYKVESWLSGKEGGARWTELGITPLNSFDAFNLKQGEEYHFRVTPRNRYGWGEAVQTTSPIGVGLAGDRPEFVDILPGQLKVLIGATANLSCSVKGKPVPEVVWMKNGHEIEEDDARVKTSFNGYNCNLTIEGIEGEDEARYSCEASNVHGRASTYARLAVVTDRLIWEADVKLKRERSADAIGEYPPQFTMRLRDRRVQATYPVRLTCQVVGNPAPAVTWFKDGEEVTLDNRHSKSQDEHFHTLEVAPTTLEDGGVYEAMARNSCGAISCHCSLVVDKGIRAYVAPEFCCGLEPLYRLTEGEELRISAVVEAYPTVGVTWYRDGVRLRPSRRAIMTLDRDGQIELALAFVTPRDAGVYTCTASNEVGKASTSGKVEVIEGAGKAMKKKTPPMVISPDVPYSKEPMFIRKPRSSEAREGDTVIIQCEVVGDPKPDVYWLRDFLKPDYYRDATHFKRVGEGPEYRFEIPHAKLDYTGAYSVVARNVHGETKAIISLQILARDPDSTEEHYIRYGRVDVIPRFERELTDLLCHDGDAIEFECHVTGHPEPDIRWFHYTDLIRESADFEWSLENGTARLRIKQVNAEDEGTYLCEASNNLGKATSSACLVVYPPGEPNTLSQRLRRPPALLSAASTPRSTPRSTPARSVSRTPGPDPRRRLCSPSRQMPPKFYTYPFNKVVEEGDHVVFQCAVKGLPAPWATWDKDGVVITPSSRITIREKDEILRILEIEEVTIEDVGIYRVTLENDYGRVEASARLEVITQKGKFYAGVRSYSASPRKSMPYRRRMSSSRQD